MKMNKLLRSVAVGATAALVAVGVSLPQSAMADDGPDKLIHYTFDSASGTVIPDVSGHGQDATLFRSGAQVTDGVLRLPGGTAAAAPYAEFPTGTLTGKDKLTVSVWLNSRSGAANTAAAFLGAPVASGQSYSGRYWLLNPSNPGGYVKSVVTNTSNPSAPWNTEIGAGATPTPTAGILAQVELAQYTTVIDRANQQMTVYVNGVQIWQGALAQYTGFFNAPLLGYLGRSTYPDTGWSGDIDDFAIYDGALTPAQVAAEYSARAVQLDLDAAGPVDPDNVRTNFSLPTTGAFGSTIEWQMSETENASWRDGVNDSSATVELVRPPAGSDPVQVTFTGAAQHGNAVLTRTFTVTIQPLPGETDDPEAYVWAFFTGEGAGAERVSLAASQGDDALRWNTLNGGEPVFTSELGTMGLRDPFIIRSREGDRFFMLATDLKIAGLSGGFDTAQRRGSRAIEIWESDDLVNWSQQRHVIVSSQYAGNTWAPEAYWDDELDTYVVFWASNLYDNPNPTTRNAVTYNRMIYVTTDDFVTFSDPQIWIDVQRGTGRGMIDSTVAKVGDTYHRFTKDEASMTIRHEKSTNLLATITGSLPGTSGPADQWTLIKEQIASGLPNGEPGKTFHSGEGPSIFPANPGDVNGFDWFLFIDQPSYHGGPNHYIPFGSNAIADGNSWQPLGHILRANLPQNSDGGKPRHGTVIPVTRAEYQSVLEAYAPAIAVDEVAPIVVSTRAGVAPVLPDATLTKADASVATVAVVWDEIDPAQYAAPGSFTVAGVAQDASRMPVTATVEVTSGLQVTAETRCVAGKVVLAVRVLSPDGDGGSATIASDFGSKAVTVGSGTSAAFSSRQVSVPAGQATVTDASGAEIIATYAARTCG
ncbi:MAG TPA: hypothetical protein PKE40_04590 [Arachnia sp.]|nr:hypothetical protein [Arachnia sp.]HMT85611.1 hypothetical protein [Arachnia sp.]